MATLEKAQLATDTFITRSWITDRTLTFRVSTVVLLGILITGCNLGFGPLRNEEASYPATEKAVCGQTYVRGGIEGTGIQPFNTGDDDGGIDGTGLHAGNTLDDPSDSDGGISGTGVSGVITAFGSICVNGLKIEYDPEQVTGAAPLAIGQVIKAVADWKDGQWIARQISQDILVSGTIETLNYADRQLTVMKQAVTGKAGLRIFDEHASEIAFDELTTGDYVYVSGFRRDNGSIIATYIGQAKAPVHATILGMARRSGDSQMTIGDQKLQYRYLDQLQLPARVQVIGQWVNGELQIDQVRNAPAFDVATLTAISIQGFIENRPAQTISLSDGFEISANAEQAIALSDLPDNPVIIEAVASPERVFRINSLFLSRENRSGDGNGPANDSSHDGDDGDGDDGDDGDGDGDDGDGDGDDGDDGDGDGDGDGDDGDGDGDGDDGDGNGGSGGSGSGAGGSDGGGY